MANSFVDTDFHTIMSRRPLALESTAFDVIIEEPNRRGVVRIDVSSAGPFLVGQSSACHIRLMDRGVSRRHAALEFGEPGLRFTDLGSTNGSFIGGVRVVEARLFGGETIRVGDTTLQIQVAARSDAVQLSPRNHFGRVHGASVAMRRLYPVFDKLANSRIPVLIEGETGTGKEVLAEALHEEGPLSKLPFVVFDCTAVPPSLVESELFGHEKGAFTGAVAKRRGVFELAHGGTLLIDEIGDLDISLQPKLLRVLERSEVRRVGGDRPIPVDVRILAATRRDLDREVQEGRFRDDLFHRLVVGRVELPPLRERRGDVEPLARHFWQQAGGDAADFPAEELARWQDAPWPGNIRELRNAVARRLAMGAAVQSFQSQDADADDDDGASLSLDEVLTRDLPLAEVRRIVNERLERAYVERMLDKHDGVVTRAAEASGIARRHFQRIRARARKD
jgi:DNA-binding NtrC family response regulator